MVLPIASSRPHMTACESMVTVGEYGKNGLLKHDRKNLKTVTPSKTTDHA